MTTEPTTAAPTTAAHDAPHAAGSSGLLTDADFRALFDGSPIAQLILDQELRVLGVNTRFRELLGYSERDIPTIEAWWDRAYPDPEQRAVAPGRWYESIASARERGLPVAGPVEVRVRCGDGTDRDLSVRVPIEGERRFVTFVDVTEQRRAQRERDSLAELHRSVVAALHDGIVVHERSGRIVAWNGAALEILGLTEDQLVGRTSTDPRWKALREDGSPFPGEEHPAAVALRTGQPVQGVLMQIDRPGRGPAWIEIHARPIHDVSGAVEAAVASFRDITAERVAREAIERANLELAVFHQVLESASEGVLITGPDGRIRYANRALESASGYGRAELIGQQPSILRGEGNDPATFAGLWASIREGRSWRGRIVNRRKDGSRYVDDVSITPIRDASGAITHHAAIQRDITEQLRAEEELRQRQKLEALGRLVGGVAHDFNNLITAISAQASLAEALLPSDHPARAELEGIQAATSRAGQLSTKLLLFGRRRMHEERVLDLGAVLEGLLPTVRRLLPETIRLDARLSSEPLLVRADPVELEQVALNLLVNARDAMPDGGTIEVVVDTLAEGGAELARLRVVDHGVGIPESARERVFEPFFTTKGEGTGLGLSTVHGIVGAAGGAVSFEGTPGGGTTFTVTLPRLAAHEQPAPKRGSSAPAAAPRTGARVLLVEDEPMIRRALERALRRAGHVVIEHESADAALAWASEDPAPGPDAVVSDVLLPGTSGPELVRRLRARWPGLAVVLTSGYTWDALRSHAELPESARFLAKPFLPRELVQLLDEVLVAPEPG